MHGFLNLDKPTGLTSRDVVNLVIKQLGRRVKAGHAGTLDPLATGVLVVALGSATRLIEHVQAQAKTYQATVLLGARSDTLDADGAIIEESDPPIPSEEAIREALAEQVGTIQQVPPQFSALKVGGRRAYELARAGKPVALEAREVRIDRIELQSYRWPLVELEVDCGAGTYIRSIARDLGDRLGCGGLIDLLRRIRVGSFSVKDAVDPRDLTAETIADQLRPMVEAVADLPQITIDADQAALIRQGRALDSRRLAAPPPAGELALIGPDGELLALALHDPPGSVRPRRVFGGDRSG